DSFISLRLRRFRPKDSTLIGAGDYCAAGFNSPYARAGSLVPFCHSRLMADLPNERTLRGTSPSSDLQLEAALPSRLLQAQPDQAVERRVVREQVLRARAVDDAAALQHDRVTGQRQRDLGMLLDQDEGGALVSRHATDRAGELLDDDRREALER